MNVSPAKTLGAIRALVVDDRSPGAPLPDPSVTRRDPDVGSVIECESGLEAIEEDQAIPAGPRVLGRCKCPWLRRLLDVLELLGADLPETVIFVTAYAATAAICTCTFRSEARSTTILKPLDDARVLASALYRAAHRQSEARSRGNPPPCPLGLPDCSEESRPDIILKGLGTKSIGSKLRGSCACACTWANDTHIVRRTIQETPSGDLDPRTFFRIAPLDHASTS